MTILITGAAGFVGFHTASALLDRGEEVLGVDSLTSYYDPALKAARLAVLEGRPGFRFRRLDVADREAVFALVAAEPGLTRVLHLAAQAGVRHSLADPYSYVEANVMGQLVMLEAALRLPGLSHFVYASSSSVYGANRKVPFSESDPVNHPVSVYAASKRSAELLAETYARLHGLPSIGLRFFTVYGPWGRPDMAYYIFTRKLFAREPIELFNAGEMQRDFTYVDDIVAGVLASLERPPVPAGTTGEAPPVPHRLYNLGNSRPEPLLKFLSVLERLSGVTARRELLPMQPGDVRETYADIAAAARDLGYSPVTPIEEGLARFLAWYRNYHQV